MEDIFSKYLTTDIAYSNSMYDVCKVQYPESLWEASADMEFPPRWAIINKEYGTIEQVAYVLAGAILVADRLYEDYTTYMEDKRKEAIKDKVKVLQ